LYILIGKTKYQKSPRKLQYIGIAKYLWNKLRSNHYAISEMVHNLSIWLREIGSVGVPGPKSKQINIGLDLAEWVHAYFLNLP